MSTVFENFHNPKIPQKKSYQVLELDEFSGMGKFVRIEKSSKFEKIAVTENFLKIKDLKIIYIFTKILEWKKEKKNRIDFC